MFGSGSACWYGPEFWMIHDIIVVTFNYRLGPLGKPIPALLLLRNLLFFCHFLYCHLLYCHVTLLAIALFPFFLSRNLLLH